jgi:hypothetical protein
MRPSKPQSPSDVANHKRIDAIAAAFSAFRRAHGSGRRIPLGLRRQFLAALDAGESAAAIGKACGVSWSQTRYWRVGAGAGAPVTVAPQVLSVVDRQASPACTSSPDGSLELRIGSWQISINRVTE